jgi:hypothetical protein
VRINISPTEYRRASAPRPDADDRTIATFRNVSMAIAVATACLSLALALATSIRADVEGVGQIAWVIAALMMISRLLRRERGSARISDSAGALAVAWIGGLGGGVLAVLGLRVQMPIADPLLLRADHALGFDGVAFVTALVGQGQWLFSIMAPTYAYTMPLVALSMCVLAAAGQRIEAWRACLCFNATMLTTCLIAIFTPAKGLGLWAPAELLAHLPDHAMTYFWGSFDLFYGVEPPVLALSSISGVISFPSFHAAMGVILIAMWRSNAFARTATCLWTGFMLLGCFAYGGHYLVDLLGGVAVAAGWFAVSRYVESSARLKPSSADTRISETGFRGL